MNRTPSARRPPVDPKAIRGGAEIFEAPGHSALGVSGRSTMSRGVRWEPS